MPAHERPRQIVFRDRAEAEAECSRPRQDEAEHRRHKGEDKTIKSLPRNSLEARQLPPELNPPCSPQNNLIIPWEVVSTPVSSSSPLNPQLFFDISNTANFLLFILKSGCVWYPSVQNVGYGIPFILP